jgi:hypothetical protein
MASPDARTARHARYVQATGERAATRDARNAETSDVRAARQARYEQATADRAAKRDARNGLR